MTPQRRPGGAHAASVATPPSAADTRVDWSEPFELVPSLAVGYICMPEVMPAK